MTASAAHPPGHLPLEEHSGIRVGDRVRATLEWEATTRAHHRDLAERATQIRAGGVVSAITTHEGGYWTIADVRLDSGGEWAAEPSCLERAPEARSA